MSDQANDYRLHRIRDALRSAEGSAGYEEGEIALRRARALQGVIEMEEWLAARERPVEEPPPSTAYPNWPFPTSLWSKEFIVGPSLRVAPIGTIGAVDDEYAYFYDADTDRWTRETLSRTTGGD